MQRMMQQTSLEAFEQVREELGDKQRLVYLALSELKSANNTMLSKHLGLPINSITPRVLELRNMKLVGVSSVAPCPITKKKTIFWRIVR